MTIQEQIVAARVAQAAIKDYTQEQVDKLVYEVAKIIYKNAEPLAREAVDETRLGCYEDKIAKNIDTPATFWSYLKDKKSVGIICGRLSWPTAPPPTWCRPSRSPPWSIPPS